MAASRGAADDLARRAATGRGASLGWHRFSVLQLAARLGVDALAARGRLPGSPLGAEAVASRAIFGAIADGSLRYFSPVAQTPGFPRAVARTIGELRLAGVAGAAVAEQLPAGPDLATLLAYIDRELTAAGAADRTLLLASADRRARPADRRRRAIGGGAPVAAGRPRAGLRRRTAIRRGPGAGRRAHADDAAGGRRGRRGAHSSAMRRSRSSR